jgi:hypothetical protein
VAKRIEELQARNERKAEAIALRRDELIEIFTEIVQAARARTSETRLSDGLKAAEMLAKMRGRQEPEQVKHGHVHLQVDSALIEQLRAGYAQLSERRAKASCPCQARLVSLVGPQQEATPHKRKARAMPRPKLDLKSTKSTARRRLRVIQ